MKQHSIAIVDSDGAANTGDLWVILSQVGVILERPVALGNDQKAGQHRLSRLLMFYELIIAGYRSRYLRVTAQTA